MEYVHLFQTVEQFNNEYDDNYKEPWISYTVEDGKLKFNDTEEEKLKKEPLTFKITGDGNIAWGAGKTAYTCTIEYKKNDGEWTSITSNTGNSAPTISVVSGDTVQFRGDNATYCSGTIRYNMFSGTTAQFKAYGNIMSLINSTGFSGVTTIVSSNTFRQLFYMCTGLTDASNLLLPATTLSEYCYANMFQGCTSMASAPELPATTLAEYCYGYMFADCQNLSYIKCLATDISAEGCTEGWVDGVASSGTFVKNPNMSSWPTDDPSGIPENWTVQDAS